MEKTDLELIKETLSGELQSYDALMIRYQQLVYNIAYSYGKTKENTMDISQNVFLKAYNKLSSFKGKSTFKTWIVRICYNESINWQKKNSRYQDHENPEDFEMNLSTSSDQDDMILVEKNKTMLLKSLYELNTRYRLAVILRYFENLSISEIANSLDCSEGVVKNMLFRSLQKLKKNLLCIHNGV